MENRIFKYQTWLTESELTEKDLDKTVEKSKFLRLHKKGIKSDLGISGKSFSYFIPVGDIKKIIDLFEKLGIEIFPDHFSSETFPYKEHLGFYFVYSDQLKGLDYKIEFNNPGKIVIKINQDYKGDLADLVDRSIRDIIEDIKKVKAIFQIQKKDVSKEERKKVGKIVSGIYRDMIEDFFIKGKNIISNSNNLSEMIVDIFSRHKEILLALDGLSDDIINKIIKGLDKPGISKDAKIVKSYLGSISALKYT